ncbi:MAG: ABC transporter permease [Alphaproteobacteria bacterium]|nr:ABC transporter permease [Alphaproteobacteria bacterium]
MEEMLTIGLSALAATLRVATPLVFCAMAGLVSERAGVIDIGLEGKMLAAAFTSASVAAVSGSALIALLAAMAMATLLGLLHGFACITHRGDQVVSGVAINIIAAGLTAVLGIHWFGRGGQTPDLPVEARFMPVFPVSATDAGAALPLRFLAEVLGGHNLLVYLAFLLVPLVWWLIGSSRFGLRLRAVGENPEVVDTAGISVEWLRYRAVMICGALCGMAGTYLAIAQNAAFTPNMTAGQGFIALAAMIFGKWRAFPALAACLLFGFLDAVAIRLQGVEIAGIGQVPVQLIQALPYILTVILLAGFIGRAVAPKAIGQPYLKER